MNLNNVTINFPKMHAAQRDIAANDARFRVLAAGRRWGKSRLGSALCVAEALQGGRAWWVAPSYPVANVGWRMIKRLASPIPNVNVRLVDKTIEFANGGEVRVRSADNPDSLRGEGLDLVVLDECAFIKEEAWMEALRPALSDRLGRAVFISTPKGRGWFWKLYTLGQDPQQAEYASWQLPTSSNPFIEPTEIDAARQSLPERIYRQEYLAEFIEDGAGCFRRVMDATTATEQSTPQAGHQYVAGVDVASMVDFTVVTVFDVTAGEMCYMDRFNRVDYTVLEDRLAALYRRFKLKSMTVEQNSIGKPVIDHLRKKGLHILPFQTTNATKQAIIQQLQAGFEHGNIKILNDPILVNELLSFEAGRTASGQFKYSAPDGMHDDCVMSLAIAYDAIAPKGAQLLW